MSEESNPLNQAEEAREPTELEVLKERAKKMGINFSNNIGVESLRQKIAEKQEGKGENYNPALPNDGQGALAADSTGAETGLSESAAKTSLFSLAQNFAPVATTEAPGPTAAPVAPSLIIPASPGPSVAELQAQLAALTANKIGDTASLVPPVNALAPEAAKAAPVRQRTLQQMMREEQTKLVRIRIQNLDPKKKDLQGEIITVANEYLGTIKKFVPYGEASEDGYHVPECIYQFLKSKRFLNIRTTRDRVTKQIKITHDMTLEYSIEVLPQLTRDDLDRLAASQAAAGSLN